jgi:hypothetical protein
VAVRYWTEDEARAYLPRLRLLLGVIRRAAHLAVNARGNGHAPLPGSRRAAPADPAVPAASAPPADPTAPAPPADPAEPADPAAAGTTAAAAGTSAAGSEGAPSPAGADEELPVAFDAEAALRELDDEGIVLRDPERGLIDFPAQHAGREVLLCWQLGEDDLAWWHLPEDGFAGRRPLPLPPGF